MADATLAILIKAKNEASAALADVKKNLGGLDDVAGKVGSTMGTALKVGAVAAAGGLVGAGFALKGFVEDAMESQKVMTQTNAVLASTRGVSGMTAESVGALADSLSRVIPVDDEVIQSAENMLLTFTNIGKDVFPQATETVLNMATALGEDTQQAAVQLGKALNDPIQGVTALRRVGVQLNDQQKAQVEAMMKVGDVAGAQKVILGELATEFGNSGRAAGETFAGKMAILNTQIGNVKERIGLALLPVLTRLADLAIQYVVPVIEDGITALSDFAAVISGALSGDIVSAAEAFNRLPGPLQTLALWLSDNRERITAIALVIRDVLVSALEGWVTIIQALGPKLVELGGFIADHKPLLIAVAVAAGVLAIALFGIPLAIAAVVIAVGLLAAHWDDIKAKTQEVWGAISDYIDENLSLVRDMFLFAFRFYSAIVFAAFETIKNYVTTAINVVRDIIKIVLALIHGDWGAAWDGVKALVGDIWNGIITDIGIKLEFLKAMLSLAWDAIKWVAAGAWNSLKDIAGDVWGRIRDAIVDPIMDVIRWINKLIDKINSIPSPGDILDGITSHLPGFASGVTNFRGGWSVVGEHGPELAYLPRGANVYSNSDSRAILAAGTPAAAVQTINIYPQQIVINGDPRAGLAALGVS